MNVTKPLHIYLCEDSLEGIFTAIYQANASHYGHVNNRIVIADSSYNQELFSEYITVTTDLTIAQKVAASIKRNISRSTYDTVVQAAGSQDMEKGDVIYRFLVLAFSIGESAIFRLGDPAVMKLMEMNRNYGGELQHYLGFLRFEEQKDGLLVGKIHPKNDIIRDMGNHFADRLSGCNFVIIDTGRNYVILYHKEKGLGFFRMEDTSWEELFKNPSEEETMMQKLWKHFVDSIAIAERKNLNLQRQMLPLRFRQYMNEFSENSMRS